MFKNNIKKYIHYRCNYGIDNKYIYAIIRVDMARYTAKQFREDFPTDDVCLDTIFENRYGDIKDCPGCGVIDTKFHRVTGRKCYACQWCGYQLHPLAQTIFHKSSTALTDWFYVIYLFSVSKNGVSALEIQRHIGVTYKTAHRMARQVRSLMQADSDKLTGIVEADETYIGGKTDSKRRFRNKTPVLGVVERGGEVRAQTVTGANASTALPDIIKVDCLTLFSIMRTATSTLGRF